MNTRGRFGLHDFGGRRVHITAHPRESACRWYPITLALQYRALAGGCLVQAGVGETIDISSRAVRLRVPTEFPARVEELNLAIAWPVALEGGKSLQWTVKARPAWRAPGWIVACIVSHEFRTAHSNRMAMAAG